MKQDHENQKDIHEPYAERCLDAIAARWDAKAQEWEDNLRDPNCHLNEDQAYHRFIEQLETILHQKRSFCCGKGVIDAGCATGLVLARAIPWFAWGIGVDISPGMIEVAKAKQIPAARFVVGDCFNLAGVCPKVAAVLSRGVLLSHYGSNLGIELLRNARNCLVEEGFILWDFLNASGRQAFQHIAKKKAYYRPEEVTAMASEAGFRSAKVLGEPERRVNLFLAEY